MRQTTTRAVPLTLVALLLSGGEAWSIPASQPGTPPTQAATAAPAKTLQRLAGNVSAGTDGLARWQCASGGDTKHPKNLELEHTVRVDDFHGGKVRLLFRYIADFAVANPEGQITAAVRLRKAGASKSTKIASFKGLQAAGSGEARAIAEADAVVEAGDTLLWSFKFKRFATLVDAMCFIMIAAVTKPDDTCRGYAPWAISEYVLPYKPGEQFVITQGNCYIGPHRDNGRYAYDFGMPVGTEIVAIAPGVVQFVDDSHPDGTGLSNDSNIVGIGHDNGTRANYVHIMQGGALVSPGDVVQQGQVIARSGNSGGTGGIPHLHLQVGPCPDRNVCGTLPITFRNSSPNPQGLQLGAGYRAKG